MAIFTALKENVCHLRSLDVSWNGVGDKGNKGSCNECLMLQGILTFCRASAGNSIGLAIPENTIIRDINLAYNSISGVSCMVIADGLMKNKVIQTVTVRSA